MEEESLGQVFDSNTDFIQENIENTCCSNMQTAFQISTAVASSSSSEVAKFSMQSTSPTSVLIPYDKSLIKIKKEKKKSRPFCSGKMLFVCSLDSITKR